MSTHFDSHDFVNALNVSRETMERLEAYAEILIKWQPSVGLIGKSSIPDLWRRHFLDCAQLAIHAPTGANVWIDIGSGAGLPGMVLSILDVGAVHLVESNSRKCEFLREVKRRTAATAIIHAARIEDLDPWPVDIITARAVAPLSKLLEYSQAFISPGTHCLFLKGQHVENELNEAAKYWNMEVKRITSIADPGGTILHITKVSHV